MTRDRSTPSTTELRVGSWLHNPATGEIAHLLAADEDGRRVEVDLWLQPGAAVAGGHVHDHFIERFEVRKGEVGFQIAGDERVARPGDGVTEAPAGTAHDWWNAGDGIAQVRVEVEAAAGGAGRTGSPLRLDDRGPLVARSPRPRQRQGPPRPPLVSGNRP